MKCGNQRRDKCRIYKGSFGCPVSCMDAENQNAAEQKERAHAIRKERKDIVKLLYINLVKSTGKNLPGKSTGIRPAKLAMGSIESGMKNTEAAQEMERTLHGEPAEQRWR